MKKEFLLPRFWPTWTCYGLLRLVTLLPYRLQMHLGKILGRILMTCSGKRRHIAKTNLALCFPDYTVGQRRELLQQHANALGMSLFEFGIGHWWPARRFNAIAEIEGLQNLQQALEQKRGAILLFGHFTTLEIMSRVLRDHVLFHPVYRKFNNPLMEYLVKRERLKWVDKVIEHDNLRSIIRSLRSNVPVFYIPDRNFGRKQALFVPFFGIATATTGATSRIAGMYNSPVLPVVQQRLPALRGYKLVIGKPLENFPTGDMQADTARISRIIEDQVRQNPADYLWVHRRFKTRPPGEPPLY